MGAIAIVSTAKIMSMIKGIINDIMHPEGTGIPPVFSKRELKRMEQLAETNTYWLKADDFAHAYNRGAEKWDMMYRKQREWLWKIKDDIGVVLTQDRRRYDENKGSNENK